MNKNTNSKLKQNHRRKMKKIYNINKLSKFLIEKSDFLDFWQKKFVTDIIDQTESGRSVSSKQFTVIVNITKSVLFRETIQKFEEQ